MHLLYNNNCLKNKKTKKHKMKKFEVKVNLSKKGRLTRNEKMIWSKCKVQNEKINSQEWEIFKKIKEWKYLIIKAFQEENDTQEWRPLDIMVRKWKDAQEGKK